MLNVVVDTNVVVSALLSPRGNPAKIIDLIANNSLRICYSPEIFAEYIDVLSRPRFTFSEDNRDDFLHGVKLFGLFVSPSASDIPLIDEDDRCFYDVAKYCEAFLITGNTRHYPPDPFTVTPTEFIALIQ